MVRWVVVVSSILLAALLVSAASAKTVGGRLHSALVVAAIPPETMPLVPGPETSVPFGWADFCRRYAGECTAGDGSGAANLALTPVLWRQIDAVNRQVNSKIDPVSDAEHWGVIDQWDYPLDGKGDCEDYALLKRKMLIGAGIARRFLLMTVVRDAHDEGHAVLTLRTDRGDLILDNMSDEIRSAAASGYRFVKRQSQDDQNVWLTLRSADVPAVAATR